MMMIMTTTTTTTMMMMMIIIIIIIIIVSAEEGTYGRSTRTSKYVSVFIKLFFKYLPPSSYALYWQKCSREVFVTDAPL